MEAWFRSQGRTAPSLDFQAKRGRAPTRSGDRRHDQSFDIQASLRWSCLPDNLFQVTAERFAGGLFAQYCFKAARVFLASQLGLSCVVDRAAEFCHTAF